MVDLDVLGSAIRIVGYTIASPGLIAWAMIAYRRKQYGIAILMVSVSLFMFCMLGAAYFRSIETRRDAFLLMSTVSVVAIAVTVVVSLRIEFKKDVSVHKKEMFGLGNSDYRRTAR